MTGRDLRKSTMTPHQYRAALAAVGLNTQARAAEFFDISIRSSHGYANGDPIPEAIVKCLRLMIKFKVKPGDLNKDFAD